MAGYDSSTRIRRCVSHSIEAFLLYGIFTRIATPLAVFVMHSWEIVALTTSGNRVCTLYRLKMTPLPGYWDADHDRPRTRNTRPSSAHCTNIFIKNPPLPACERRSCYSRLSPWLQTRSIQRDTLARKRQ